MVTASSSKVSFNTYISVARDKCMCINFKISICKSFVLNAVKWQVQKLNSHIIYTAYD
jgi:hypothetical protein